MKIYPYWGASLCLTWMVCVCESPTTSSASRVSKVSSSDTLPYWHVTESPTTSSARRVNKVSSSDTLPHWCLSVKALLVVVLAV